MPSELIEQTTATAVEEQDEQLEALNAALQRVEQMLAKISNEVKTGSVADFCRLIQMQIDLHTEIAARNPNEKSATWVDPEYLKN